MTRSSYETAPEFQPPAKSRVLALQAHLVEWYRRVRRDLPWRKTRDPYAIWLSEVMLQQTRVETVIPYYERFLEAFPTVEALAEAPLEAVLARWSGLGYYRRARMLHRAAQEVAREHGGVFPKTAAGLRELHGIGAYTAGAVASIAHGERAALVDGNVARVFARLFAIEGDVTKGPGHRRVWALAEALVPADAPGDFNQALMELGATVCVPREPRCLVCPVRDDCEARAQGRERALPTVVAKAAPTLERRTALVVKDAGHLVLARRAAEGVFAGMWEPPSLVSSGDEAADAKALRKLVGLTQKDLAGPLENAGSVVHVLSHRRLEVTVLAAEALPSGRGGRPRAWATTLPAATYERFDAVLPEALGALALTTYARKVLAKARAL